MEPLFITGPVYDKHVTSIVNLLLVLKNNNPKQDSKCYLKNCKYVKELYDGTFLRHQFSESNFSQFDVSNYQDKITSCKGSWQNIRNVIQDSLKHIDMARDKRYMPFNKKFIENISFASFFESYSLNSFNGEIDCNFIKFINEPKMSKLYCEELKLEKIKSEIDDFLKTPAEKICKKYFKMIQQKFTFWTYIKDLQRWLKLFKSTFPYEYGEFINNCDNGNPLIDFKNFIVKMLKDREGDNFVLEIYEFKVGNYYSEDWDKCMCGYTFKNWIRSNLHSKFNVLKYLPRPFDTYYTDESFQKVSKQVIKQKEVVDIEDIPIF